MTKKPKTIFPQHPSPYIVQYRDKLNDLHFSHYQASDVGSISILQFFKHFHLI